MKCHIQGLHNATPLPDGFFLVRVAFARYSGREAKPYLALELLVQQPTQFAGRKLPTRLYSTDKALWKLNWFLRDFGYDSQLLAQDEVDDRAVIGLTGVVRVSHSAVNGRTFLNLDGFAPAAEWDDFSLKAAG